MRLDNRAKSTKRAAIANYSISPRKSVQPVLLDIAEQTACYLHMQDGAGFSTSLPSFGTGIFAIYPPSGNVETYYGLSGATTTSGPGTVNSSQCHCPSPLYTDRSPSGIPQKTQY